MGLRKDLAVRASLLGCPDSQVDFLTTTTLFALWVAVALGRVVSGGDDPGVSLQGWSARMLRALVWSLRHQDSTGLVSGDHDDAAAWELLLVTQDAVPLFFELAKRDAERIQQLAMGGARPSTSALEEARRAFVRKVVPVLNARYASEN